MEIKLSAGDKIQIPTGCKATIEDNLIIIEEKKEEQKEEFKDGDILCAQPADIIVIFKSFEHNRSKTFRSYYNSDGLENTRWSTSCFKHATEEEKQRLFDKLKEQGLRWNAETKTIEKIRKRVKKGGEILIITSQGGIITSYDDRDILHDMLWNLGNYYLPNELEKAQEDLKAIRAIFEKRLKVKL